MITETANNGNGFQILIRLLILIHFFVSIYLQFNFLRFHALDVFFLRFKYSDITKKERP
jgi:hypothetical protein